MWAMRIRYRILKLINVCDYLIDSYLGVSDVVSNDLYSNPRCQV